MRAKRSFPLITLAASCLIGQTAYAHQGPDRRALNVEDECIAKTSSNIELSECFKSRLADLDQQMGTLMERAVARTVSDSEEATEETHARMREAQSSWLIYRKASCWSNYVPHQRVNSSFRAAYNFYCEIAKTYDRMDEISTDYLVEELSDPSSDETD